MLGAGFWSRYQMAAWREVPGVECVAVYNRTADKAEALAREFGVPAVYDDAETLIRREQPDFVDIVTDPSTHAQFVALAARLGTPVICQKPMAPSREEARQMVKLCRDCNVPFFIHENWRWQTPIRAFNEVLQSGRLGEIIRGRIDYAHSYPVFDNQPFLKELDRFILMDVGTHLLDVARFLWGEAAALQCQTRRMHRDIRGEDVATVLLRMESDVTVTVNLSYASRWEFDRFPETFIQVEGTDGGASLGADYSLRIYDKNGEEERRTPPARYDWAHPEYALIHASIVDCHRNLIAALRGEAPAETTAEDNLKTLELVFAAYNSAATGTPINPRPTNPPTTNH